MRQADSEADRLYTGGFPSAVMFRGSTLVRVHACVLSPSRRTDKARRLISRGSHNPAERENVSARLSGRTRACARAHTHTRTD